MCKTIVTISKEWNNPEIKISVTKVGMDLFMDIKDFEEALFQETKSFVFTKNQYRKQLREGFSKVLSEIKKESTKVIK